MAIPQSLNNLKDNGSKEDKVAVASGIAVSVVIVLLAAWAIFFFRSIEHNTQSLNLSGGAQDQFNFQSVTEAQQQLQQDFGSSTQDLVQVRNDVNQSGQGAQMQTQQMQIQGSGGTDQFGSQNTGY